MANGSELIIPIPENADIAIGPLPGVGVSATGPLHVAVGISLRKQANAMRI